MDSKKLFEKYYSRIALEGVLKSAIIGLIVGCALDILISFVTLFVMSFKYWFLVALGVGIAAGVITAIILYYKAFRPTTKKIAERIDSLGLEERMITMTELENNESFIAMKQREDAKAKLGGVNTKNIRFSIARPLIIAVSILGVIGLSFTTVNALTGFGVINWKEIFPPKLTDDDYVTVTYLISGNGTIEGESYQEKIIKGQSATTVVAVPDSNWVFIGWDDGLYFPERTDSNLYEDLTITACFEEVGADGGTSGEYQDSPQKNNDDGNNNANGDPGDNKSEGDDLEAAGSRYDPANQIIDGETPYMDDYDTWYKQAMEELLENGNLTAEQLKALETYFEALNAGANTGSNGNNNQ